MSLADLDANLTAPKRLAAMGLLVSAKEIEFSFLKDQLGISDSDLSKQLRVLIDAGYVTTRRTGKGSTRVSWFAATTSGRSALDAHAEALRNLLDPTTTSAPLTTDVRPSPT